MSARGLSVVVIGAGKGLGRAAALRYARDSARLVLASRTPSDLDEVARKVAELGGEAVTMTADATIATEVEQVRILAHETFGGEPHVVLNTTGAALLRDLPDTSLEEWARVIDSSLKSVFLTVRAFLPRMMVRGSGQIITLGSRAAYLGPAQASVYSSAKAGVSAFTQAWAKEAMKHGVKLLNIAPGPMDTPMRWSATPNFPKESAVSADAIADLIAWTTSYPELTFEGDLMPKSINH